MANLQHSTLPSASVHEPKHITINGISSSGKVITNSAVSSSVSVYRRLVQDDLDELEVILQAEHLAATSALTFYLPATFTGTIVGLAAIVDSAITTASNTYELQIDGVTVTGSPLTLTTVAGSGGTAGDIVTSNPSAANTFNSGQVLTVVSTAIGNTDATVDVRFIITIQRS